MSTAAETKKPNLIRRLYDWVLHWAETPYGAPALFLLAFAESSFFPIPPDVLLIALAIAVRKKAFRFALICSVGSVLGGMFGYYIGFALFAPVAEPVIQALHLESKAGRAMSWYKQYDVWVVGAAAFTPIPYKVFTILAGFARLDFGSFVLASILGRSGRFFLVSGLIYLFGERIKHFIDTYFNWCCLAFMVLLIGAFALIGQMGGHFEITAPPDQIDALIAKLESADPAERAEAHKELSIKTEMFFGFRPDAPETEREDAVKKWRDWFDEWKKQNE